MKLLAAYGALRLSYYAKAMGREDLFSSFPRLLDPEITQALLAEYEDPGLLEDEIPLQRLLALCGENRIASTCLALCALQYMEPTSNALFSAAAPVGSGGVTVALAGAICHPGDELFDYFQEAQDAFDRVTLLLNASENGDFPTVPLTLDARLADYAAGGARLDARLEEICAVFDGPLEEPYILSRRITQIAGQLTALGSGAATCPVVHISGAVGMGKKFAAKHIGRVSGLELLFVDGAFLKGKPPWVLAKTRVILREALLGTRLICLHGLNAEHPATLLPAVKRFLREAERLHRPIFVTSEANIRILPFVDNPVLELPLSPCTPQESQLLWEGFTALHWGRHSTDCRELAAKMRLSPAVIEKIVRIAAFSLPDQARSAKSLFRICYDVLNDGRYDNVKRVEAGYTWDDLKLAREQKNILQYICNQIEYRLKVMVDWNMRSKYAYGACASVLFSGPPGTGKTMAAHVLSSMLGLELYKVDLSQVVDKYIGETEKRLEEVFARAEKTNMILFFDEADAVLGKRSEVKDAKDKHANTEVSYLLQRIEEYDGIVILATNNIHNIDAAFIRRIRYVMSFPIPDKETRLEIWRSSIPEEVPTQGIDFDFLAEKFEFPGGNIKNCILNAVFFAAAEDCPLSMKHLLQAVYLENTKDKHVAFSNVFGQYAYLIDC